jgi:hypothetical protein
MKGPAIREASVRTHVAQRRTERLSLSIKGSARKRPAAHPEATQAVAEVRDGEDAMDEGRERFHKALRAAHRPGANYGLLSRLVGLTRQRVARIIDRR